jgi:hypothetical protein
MVSYVQPGGEEGRGEKGEGEEEEDEEEEEEESRQRKRVNTFLLINVILRFLCS